MKFFFDANYHQQNSPFNKNKFKCYLLTNSSSFSGQRSVCPHPLLLLPFICMSLVPNYSSRSHSHAPASSMSCSNSSLRTTFPGVLVFAANHVAYCGFVLVPSNLRSEPSTQLFPPFCCPPKSPNLAAVVSPVAGYACMFSSPLIARLPPSVCPSPSSIRAFP